MKKGLLRIRWAVGTTVLVLALAPTALIAIVLGSYIVTTRLEDAQQSLIERGHAIANHLAPASEYGIFSGNREMLQSLANAAVTGLDIAAATIFDVEKKLVVHAGHRPVIWPPALGPEGKHRVLTQQGEQIVIASPVYAADTPVLGKLQRENGAANIPEILGWVLVTLSNQSVHARQRQIILNSLLITLCVLFISGAIAIRIGRGITKPIQRLTASLRDVREGDLDTRVIPDSAGELATLERGFNQMAATIQEAHTALQDKVDAATGELRQTLSELEVRNRELDQARRQAVLASEAKANFLADMSHEIRTPMNAILGFSNLLKSTTDTDKQEEYIQIISKSASGLVRILNDILTLSQSEYSRLEIDEIPFDLRACIDDTIDMLTPEAHEKSLELLSLIYSDVPTKLYGDPIRIGEVLVNFLSNAVKFTERGSVTVETEFLRGTENHAAIRISVIDTGIGIAQEKQKEIFRAFSQADSSIRRRFGGTGLGLAIVNTLVERLGGRLGLQSEPGQGSTFWVELELRSQPAQADDVSASTDLTGIKALLFDAHPLSRRILRNHMLAAHMDVRIAASLERALDMLSAVPEPRGRFQLVVCALATDQSDPRQAQDMVAAIRARYPGPLLLILGTNCELSAAERYQPILVGAKPMRRSLFFKYIRKLLRVPPARDEQTPDKTELPPAGRTDDLTGLRILVTEDNDFNRTLIKTLLQQHGAQVAEAAHGGQALDLVHQHGFDLIIMDIHMPVINGIEATKQIRTLTDRVATIPVIGMTADIVSEQKEELYRCGISDCLFKPITEQELVNIVLRWAGSPHRPYLGASQPDEPSKTAEVPQHLYSQLLRELPPQLAALQQAFADDNLENLRNAAHQIHGLAGYFNIVPLSNAARALEQAVYGEPDEALAGHVEQIHAWITQLLEQRSGAPQN